MPLSDPIASVCSRQNFFVCGAPKSGTTWVQRLLDAHPEVACGGEGHFIDTLAPALADAFNKYNRQQRTVRDLVYEGDPYYSGLDQNDLDHVVALLASRVMAKRGIGEAIRCVGDKTPRYSHHLPQLVRVFPGARIINVVRDGRDAVASLCNHAYRSGHPEARDPEHAKFVDWIRHFARTWVSNVTDARTFGQAHPGVVANLFYEDLQNRPQQALGQTFAFLGVRNDAEVIQQCLEAADFRRLSGGRAPGEESRESFFHKGVSGGWRDLIGGAALEAFYEEAGETMRALGYATEAATPSEGGA